MTDGLLAIQMPAYLQVFNDKRVGILHKLSGKRIATNDLALKVYHMNKIKTIILPRLIIGLTVGRCDMNNAGSVFHRNKIALNYTIGQLFLRLLQFEPERNIVN